jgi:hypothetical protein
LRGLAALPRDVPSNTRKDGFKANHLRSVILAKARTHHPSIDTAKDARQSRNKRAAV